MFCIKGTINVGIKIAMNITDILQQPKKWEHLVALSRRERSLLEGDFLVKLMDHKINVYSKYRLVRYFEYMFSQ